MIGSGGNCSQGDEEQRHEKQETHRCVGHAEYNELFRQRRTMWNQINERNRLENSLEL